MPGYECEECCIVVVVGEPSGREPCDVVCCGVPVVRIAPKANAQTKTKGKK